MTIENKFENKSEPNKFENKSDPKRGKSSTEIEAQISETRNSLTDDIKALGDKVSPENIKREVKQGLKDASDVAVEKAIEVKDAVVDKAVELKDATVVKAQQAADVISETADEVAYQSRRIGAAAWRFTAANAVPLSLVGLGIGWMVASARSGRTERGELSAHTSAGDQYVPSSDMGYEPNAYSTGRSGALKNRRRSADNGSRPIGDDGMRARGDSSTARSAAATLSRAATGLGDRAMQGKDMVQRQVQRAGRASVDFAKANPLALALGALAAGVGVGLLLPSTGRENQWFGPSRDKLKHVLVDAREAAMDVGAVAKQTAKDTMATVEGTTH